MRHQEDLCCISCVSAWPKDNLCPTQTLLFRKTAWRQSFVASPERRGHFKLTTVFNVSSATHITNVTYLQRTPVVSILRLRKWHPWVYLREIMESYSDGQFMYFEWYHLQAAAPGLIWKQGDWNSFGHISVLWSRYKDTATGLEASWYWFISLLFFFIFWFIILYFSELPAGLTTSRFFILIAEWFLFILCHVLQSL